MTKRILIAGCGDVGNALAKRLLADGCQVWGIRRNVSALREGIQPWRVDLTDAASLRDPPAKFDQLFYTASADGRDEASYRAIYVDGLNNLLRALRGADSDPERVFFTSSTAVYGQHNGEWVDEGSATEPGGFNGRILLEAEQVVRETKGGVAVRLSGIYGPGRTRLIDKVWTQKAEGTQSWTNRIHVEDSGALLYHLMRIDAHHDLYLGSDDEPVTTADVYEWMSAALGVPKPEAIVTERTNKRCRNTRLRETGYRFIYPTFRDGYAPMIEEFLRDRSRS